MSQAAENMDEWSAGRVKRHAKAVKQVHAHDSRLLRKSNKLLQQLLAMRALLIHVSPAHDDAKADIRMALDEAEAHLRDQRLL
jgi:hypothetical protein